MTPESSGGHDSTGSRGTEGKTPGWLCVECYKSQPWGVKSTVGNKDPVMPHWAGHLGDQSVSFTSSEPGTGKMLQQFTGTLWNNTMVPLKLDKR
jgi:hypothetical protein